MIRVLVLEDDVDFFTSISDLIKDTGFQTSITHAMSRDSALELLKTEQFDFITVDQKIPTKDGALDSDTDHGRAVLESINDNNIGTPTCILTALSGESYFRNILAISSPIDIWGAGTKTPTINFLPKEDIVDLPEILEVVFRQIVDLDDIEITAAGDQEPLSWHEKKLIRIFVKRIGGVRCNVNFLSGGLSDSVVIRIDVFDSSGSEIQNAILKIGTREMVQEEAANFEFVKRLSHDAAPTHLVNIEYGAGKYAAIAFQLAKRFERSIFDLVLTNGDVTSAINQLSTLLAPWTNARMEKRLTVGEIRRFILSDKKTVALMEEFDLGWVDEFERREVQAHIGVIHGDLHGENILVDTEGVPVLIDYGDIHDRGPQLLDWVTLEHSILFHPKTSPEKDTFFDHHYLDHWDSANYCEGSPYVDFFQQCRTHSTNQRIGYREYIACVFAYVLRQLTYLDTDKDLALAFLEKCRVAFSD